MTLEELEVYKYLNEEDKRRLSMFTFGNSTRANDNIEDNTLWVQTYDILLHDNKIGMFSMACLENNETGEYKYDSRIDFDNSFMASVNAQLFDKCTKCGSDVPKGVTICRECEQAELNKGTKKGFFKSLFGRK